MVILAATNARKSLGRRPVLRGATIAIDEGERVFVVGENGCGKSTLLHVLSGVLEPDYGSVERAGTIGFAPEKPDLPDHLLVREWLSIVAGLKGGDEASIPAELGVSDLRDKRTSALSLGQRQRVSLATAWLARPRILVLDEPTNALDAASRTAVIDLLRESTILVATHDRELADRLATRVVTVTDGKVRDFG